MTLTGVAGTARAEQSSRPPGGAKRALGVAGLVFDVVAILACAAWAARLSAGMDVSWDLLAYHQYYSWLFVEGHMHLADPEPYVNRYQSPLAELPWYLIDSHLSPRAATAVTAALAGVNLPLIRRITMRVAPSQLGPGGRWLLGVASCLLAGVGAVFSMELGMSAGDVIVSIPMLGAVLLLLQAGRPGSSGRSAAWLYVGAGAPAGVAVGMKLTMANYAIGLGAAAVSLAVARRTVRPVWCTAVGGVVGLAVSAGWWFADVWRLTGSPVFPFYNTIFHSPLWGDYDVRDDRFGAHGLMDALSYPWLMAQGTPRVLDVPMRDLRWVLLAGLLLLAVAATSWRAARRRHGTRADVGPLAAFWVFFAVSGVLWLFQFGIARYAVTSELLTGTALVLCLVAVLRRPAVVLVVAAALAVAMAPFNEGHFYHVPFQKGRFMVEAGPLRSVPLDSVVMAVNTSAPSGYLLEYLPAGTRRHIYQGWFAHSPLLAKLRNEQLSTAPHIYLVLGPAWPRQPRVRQELRDDVGLVVDDTRCLSVHSTLPVRHLCPARYVGVPTSRG